ncbi:MAG TPA: hypothetical protein VIU15_26115 [Streptomyces sp.]
MGKLGTASEPESPTWLKTTIRAMLPSIDLPDMLLKVRPWTGFPDALKHVSEFPTRMNTAGSAPQLALSIRRQLRRHVDYGTVPNR